MSIRDKAGIATFGGLIGCWLLWIGLIVAGVVGLVVLIWRHV